MEGRPPLTERISFSFATTSTDTEPLSTWRQQLGTVWTSLDWLMLTRILKSDICVTIAFILSLTYWGWHDIGTSMVLSSIAIEFIHPAGSYGRIWEVGSLILFLIIVFSTMQHRDLPSSYLSIDVRTQHSV
jgi:hypothetical protein